MNISVIGFPKFVSDMRVAALGLCALALAGYVPQAMASAAEKPVLGYMLDISRDKVPTTQSLYRMVDILAVLGYDQFQLYSEHTFAYKDHEQVWNDSSPLSAAEIRALDDYCAKKGIALVPNQNSFGHLEKWFRRPAYRPLAEAPEGGVRTPWGSTMVVPRALCPTDPKSLEFVDSLYAELLPNFRSDLLNVGCDEVWELQSAGKGRSWETVQKVGEARVWLDYFKKVCALAAKYGKTALFWDDMVARSHPELLGEIPANAIALDWGYEIGTKHNYDRECGRLRDAGVRFYVCPGSSGWNAISGRHDNMKSNVEEAVSAGLKYGAIGYLMTDWGNGGHCQPWITALPSLIYMAERVKGVSLTDEELAARIDKLVGCRCGKALLRYQNLYLKSGAQKTNNASPLYKMLSGGKAYRRPKWMTDDCLKAVFSEWRAAQKDLDLAGAPEWVKDGFATMDLLYSALELRWKGEHERVRQECPAPFRALWLKYNRPGGLDDSVQQNFHGDKVTEVVFSFDTEDFTSPRDAEGILELAKMFTEEGVVAHFQTVGFLAQQLVKWGRQDVIAAMKKHYICCHTLRHSLHPNILELSEGEDYAAAYKRVYDQEKACLDILKGVFGVDRIWSSCPPGNSEPYVANRVYADLGIKFDLGASFLPNEGPDIWFGGIRRIPYSYSWEQYFREGFDYDPAKILDRMAKMNRFVAYCHPNKVHSLEFWDMINYRRENKHPWGEWEISPERSPTAVKTYLNQIRTMVRAIKADPRFRIVTISDLCATEKPRVAIERKHVAMLRKALQKDLGPITSPASWCVSDVFSAAVRFLRGEDKYLPVNAYGFLYRPVGVAQDTVVTRAELVAAAKALDDSTFLPAQIKVGGAMLGPADFLFAALETLDTGAEKVTVKPCEQLGSFKVLPNLEKKSYKNSWLHVDSLKDEWLSDRMRWQLWTLRYE